MDGAFARPMASCIATRELHTYKYGDGLSGREAGVVTLVRTLIADRGASKTSNFTRVRSDGSACEARTEARGNYTLSAHNTFIIMSPRYSRIITRCYVCGTLHANVVSPLYDHVTRKPRQR